MIFDRTCHRFAVRLVPRPHPFVCFADISPNRGITCLGLNLSNPKLHSSKKLDFYQGYPCFYVLKMGLTDKASLLISVIIKHMTCETCAVLHYVRYTLFVDFISLLCYIVNDR